MISGQELLIVVVIALTVWVGSEIAHGVKKIGHGTKIVACKMHIVSCKAKK